MSEKRIEFFITICEILAKKGVVTRKELIEKGFSNQLISYYINNSHILPKLIKKIKDTK